MSASNGFKTFVRGQWRMQLYWPQFRFQSGEALLVVSLVVFRIVWTDQYRGFGFELLGFGLGADWERKR